MALSFILCAVEHSTGSYFWPMLDLYSQNWARVRPVPYPTIWIEPVPVLRIYVLRVTRGRLYCAAVSAGLERSVCPVLLSLYLMADFFSVHNDAWKVIILYAPLVFDWSDQMARDLIWYQKNNTFIRTKKSIPPVTFQPPTFCFLYWFHSRFPSISWRM